MMEWKERKISFKNKSNEKLIGIMNESVSSDVVIMCHGYTSGKNQFLFPKLAQALGDKKLSSLRFDFSGNGESEGTFEFGNYTKEANDIRSAIEHIRNELNRKVIGIIGHSKGGTDVLLYASMYDDVPNVVNICGRFNMNDGIIERFGDDIFERLDKYNEIEINVKNQSGHEVNYILTKRSMEERLALDMKSVCEKIKSSEILTIHGTDDKTVTFDNGEMVSKHVKPHTFFPVEGACHSFVKPEHAELIINKIVSFITEGWTY